MTLAMTPGERVRAAAISSRPTWARNLTAGSVAAAGGGAAVSHATHAIARTHAERLAAGSRNSHLDIVGRRLPITVDMLCPNPSVARFQRMGFRRMGGRPPARYAKNTPGT